MLPPGQTDAVLDARIEARWDETCALLERLYPGADLAPRVLEIVRNAAASRPPRLRALDAARAADPGWFLAPEQVGYVCYVDRFAGTLRGVGEHLDHLDALGVRYLHLMPLLATRPGEDDGGYAVSDYDAIEPRLGTMAELSELADRLHERGVALCVDVALNHTAREHEWAQRALSGDAHYRDYYLVFPDRTMPDAYERTTIDIFPELAPGTFTFVPELDGWVWTSFREFQWDLNWANPDVFAAMLATMLRLANRGPDVLRIDAAPFLRKRLGTTCLDLPETHLVLQALRALTWMAAPGVLLKAEAMLEPDAVLRYLGDATPECDLAYDNQAMVMLWSSLALGDTRLAAHALGRRAAPPARATWVTYVRCHDDIGWAVDDADAVAVGLDGPTVRARVSDFYSASGRGAVFQHNATGAHPISGMTASLCGAPDDPLALRRLETLYSVAFSLGGVPLVYMGDEFGMLSDADWEREPAHRGDNRWLHRPLMDWAADSPVFERICALSRVRRETPELHANAPLRILPAADGVLAYSRGDDFVALANFTDRAVAAHDGELLHGSEGTGATIPPAGFGWWRRDRRPGA